MHSHVWNSGSWRRGLWGDRTAFPLGPTSICWSMETTQHWTAQAQEWDWGGGKTSRGALKPSQTLRALWSISRRIQGNGLNLHLHLHLYLHEKWETSPQNRETLPVERYPHETWAVLPGPWTPCWLDQCWNQDLWSPFLSYLISLSLFLPSFLLYFYSSYY